MGFLLGAVGVGTGAEQEHVARVAGKNGMVYLCVLVENGIVLGLFHAAQEVAWNQRTCRIH